MDRRKFLTGLLGVTAAGLIVPGAKKFFLPPRGGWPVKNGKWHLEMTTEHLLDHGFVDEDVAPVDVSSGNQYQIAFDLHLNKCWIWRGPCGQEFQEALGDAVSKVNASGGGTIYLPEGNLALTSKWKRVPIAINKV